MYGGRRVSGLGDLPNDISSALNQQAVEIADLTTKAQATGDATAIDRARVLADEWQFAMSLAYAGSDKWPDSTVRAQLGYVDNAILQLTGRLQQLGVPVSYRGVAGTWVTDQKSGQTYTVENGPLPSISATLSQAATNPIGQVSLAAARLGLPASYWWLLPVAGGAVLVMVLRR